MNSQQTNASAGATDELIAGGPAVNRRGFGSDNHSGAHPAVIEAFAQVNAGHVDAYGDDPWTKRAEEILAAHFGTECTVALTFNGTGTNIMALAAALDPWSAVVCAEQAHINTDECGAAQHVVGAQLYTCPTREGKLTPEMVQEYFWTLGSEHHRQPRVISITNLTEMGTLYTPGEIRRLADFAHENNMLLHVDGARLANAAVALGSSIAELTGYAGVDMLSFGGTKNGLIAGEALILGERVPAHSVMNIRSIRKLSLQLFSKQRFAAAQFIAMYENDLWRQCAGNANDMTLLLHTGATAAGVEFLLPPHGNELFALLPHEHVKPLQDRFRFYTWREDERPGLDSVRWVCSWDTTREDVSEFVTALKGLGL